MSRRRRAAAATGRGERAEKVRDVYVGRPFEGLTGEADWVALRELVPAATAPVALAADLVDKHGERSVTLSTVLPMAWPALTKSDGRVFVGLQRTTQSGDVSRDLALSLLLALETEPGQPVSVPPLPGPGPRLQDVLAPGADLDVSIHDGFEYWLDGESGDPEIKASLERANASVFPAVRMQSAPAAYWCQFPEKAHIRWVLPDQEDTALAALARLSARSQLDLGDKTRFAGMFRAHGLLVPVWDLPQAAGAPEWESALAEVAGRYALALAEGSELDGAQRRARQGLLTRQVTLR